MASPPDPGFASDLCPLDSRRSTRELAVKLFVVHFTTIAGFCHVLSIRNEHVFSWRLLFFIIEPLSSLIPFLFSIIIMIAAVLMYLIQPTNDRKRCIKFVAIVLFSPAGKSSRPSSRPSLRRADTENQRHSARNEEDSDDSSPQAGLKRLGRVVLAIALLAQCVCTITLYLRRKDHDAITLVDQRVFELACASIGTALLWLAVLALSPTKTPDLNLKEEVLFADRDLKKSTVVDLAAQGVRFFQLGADDGSHVSSNDDKILHSMMFMAIYGTLALLTEICVGKIDIWGFLKILFSWTAFRTDAYPIGWQGSIVRIIHILTMLWAVVTVLAVVIGALIGQCVFSTVCLPLSVFMYVFVLLLCLGGIGFYTGWIVVFVRFVQFYLNLARQITALERWPLYEACPLLWSDPPASWLWALA